MNEPIDWPLLAQHLIERGCKGYGSTQAMAALELIVGEEAIRQAVDYYVAWKPEAELARNVLWRLRPWSAMQRCYEIYHSGADIEQRRAAIDLLRVVADERALDWIEEFLADPDDGIQGWGIGVLDQFCGAVACPQMETCQKRRKAFWSRRNGTTIHMFKARRPLFAAILKSGKPHPLLSSTTSAGRSTA